MPHIEKSPWVCVGIKRVSITRGEFASSTCDGMVTIYTLRATSEVGIDAMKRSPMGNMSASDNGDGGLHVMIADGVNTYYKCILRRDIRHVSPDDGNELEKIASVILCDDDESFKVNYKRVEGQIVGGSLDSKNTTSVLVSVRKTYLNNIVRTVWEGQFNDICHSCQDDIPSFFRHALANSDPTVESSGLALPILLGDTINELHKEIDALRSENKRLDENTLQWKSTAEKLSNQWETEKSELTERFLVLFNDHKARHVETRKELEHLQGKKQRTDDTISNRLGSRRSRDLMPDDEDEHDYVSYKKEDVDRLAKGRSLKRGSENDKSGSGSGFVNPYTGSMEYSHAKELFSSDDEESEMTT